MDWSWIVPVIVAGIIVVVAIVGSRRIDRLVEKRVDLPPEARTRFRIVLHAVETTVVAFAVLSVLLLIPGLRPVVSGLLASSAVIGVVVGFAARPTLGNFISGLMLAFTQPLRIGDEVEVDGVRGRVTEIGRSYSTIVTGEGGRLFVPNERLSTNTIRNLSVGAEGHVSRIRVPVPMTADVQSVLPFIAEEARSFREATAVREPVVSLLELGESSAVVALDVWARDPRDVERLASDLRVRIQQRLRERGVYSE
jgi:small-conductance mechanosensitive channel